MKRLNKVAFILLFLPLVIGMSCRPSANGEKSDLLRQTVAVARGDLVVSVSGNGTVTASTDVKLAFDKGGKVSQKVSTTWWSASLDGI